MALQNGSELDSNWESQHSESERHCLCWYLQEHFQSRCNTSALQKCKVAALP